MPFVRIKVQRIRRYRKARGQPYSPPFLPASRPLDGSCSLCGHNCREGKDNDSPRAWKAAAIHSEANQFTDLPRPSIGTFTKRHQFSGFRNDARVPVGKAKSLKDIQRYSKWLSRF